METSATQVLPSATHVTSLSRPVLASKDGEQKPVALLISHGMGQQVPFATIAAVDELLRNTDDAESAAPSVTHVRFVDPDTKRETWLPRAELQVAGPNGEPPRTVHVYEVYWAPLTEGNITLSETVRFMASAGWERVRLFRGGTARIRKFQRWLFGQAREFEVRGIAAWGLILALTLVVSLVVINGMLTLVAGANLIGVSKLSKMPAKLVDFLTLDLAILLGVAGLAGGFLLASKKIILKLSKRSRRLHLSTQENQSLNNLRAASAVHTATEVLLIGAGISLIVVAACMVIHYATIDHESKASVSDPSGILQFIWRIQPAQLQMLPAWLREPDWAAGLRMAFISIVWAVTVVCSLYLRNRLVKYMGDVAIYLDAYKVDKFRKVREEIKREAYQTACALYGARQGSPVDPQQPLSFAYDRVLLVGHSLGSVVAYDALNATLHLDESMSHSLKAAECTGGLITFGSPLDKTAYIFATRTAPTSVRPPLAASVQPMIRSTRVRQLVKWINIYSPSDIVSNKLKFYDAPENEGSASAFAIDNREDKNARTPLLAHNQYWDNQALATVIRERIFAG